MQYRRLGRSGLLVSPIALGTMTFGEPVGEAEAIGLVHAALDLGVNFIDTANVYEGYARYLGSPGGVAESIVGKAICDRRDQVVLATKVGAPVGPGPQDRGLSASHLLRELDRSLRRLQTDYIDLYLIHWPDKRVPIETTLDALRVAVDSGKVRYFGASNHVAWRLCEIQWLAERGLGPHVVASQIPFSLLRREFQPDLEFCQQYDIGVTPYQALQGGLLTGKYHRQKPPPRDSRAADKPEWMWELDETLFDRLEALAELAAGIDVSLTRYAVAWTLAQPAITSLIVGAKRIAQIEDVLQGLEVKIPDEHFDRIDAVCPAPGASPTQSAGKRNIVTSRVFYII